MTTCRRATFDFSLDREATVRRRQRVARPAKRRSNFINATSPCDFINTRHRNERELKRVVVVRRLKGETRYSSRFQALPDSAAR
jgi:hypothetical protein